MTESENIRPRIPTFMADFILSGLMKVKNGEPLTARELAAFDDLYAKLYILVMNANAREMLAALKSDPPPVEPLQ